MSKGTLRHWVDKQVNTDLDLDTRAGLLVLAAWDGPGALQQALGGQSIGASEGGPEPGMDAQRGAQDASPREVYLESLTVEGFRGIGAPVRLALQPRPGLTVVAGRNGSGKSSLVEALEFTLTRDTFRWKGHSPAFKTSWRNLHHPMPSAVTATFVTDQGGTLVATTWDADCNGVDGGDFRSQVKGKQQHRGELPTGWTDALETFRPLMPYEEIGHVLQGKPSELHDALAKGLGLEQIDEALALLTEAGRIHAAQGRALSARRKALRERAGQVDGAAAAQAATILGKIAPDIARLTNLVTGYESVDDTVLTWLQALTELTLPTTQELSTASDELRAAVQGLAAAADTGLAAREEQLQIRRLSVDFVNEHGACACPACGVTPLDAGWAEQAHALIVQEEAALSAVRTARARLHTARRRVTDLVRDPPSYLTEVALEELRADVLAAQNAWQTWRQLPDDDLDRATRVANLSGDLDAALSLLRSQASAMLQQRRDTWSPLARDLAAFCGEWQVWAAGEDSAAALATAKEWLTVRKQALRDERLQPILGAALQAWGSLRQESNVEIGDLRLEGANTRRKAVIEASVDGARAEAMSVMSQGELQALSLALFLPRATLDESPFRFVILDDPVQAMDPAKIDGLLTLLAGAARTRQVIVFSHDDRLTDAARRSPHDVHLLQVSRNANSQVSVEQASDPATRYLAEAAALIRDKDLPDETKRRCLPGLWRLATESAAKDIYFARELSHRGALIEIEGTWSTTLKTAQRVSLALHGEVRDLHEWLRPTRRSAAMGILSSGLHEGVWAHTNLGGAHRDVQTLIADLRSGVAR